jgi:hypothetical protein
MPGIDKGSKKENRERGQRRSNWPRLMQIHMHGITRKPFLEAVGKQTRAGRLCLSYLGQLR